MKYRTRRKIAYVSKTATANADTKLHDISISGKLVDIILSTYNNDNAREGKIKIEIDGTTIIDETLQNIRGVYNDSEHGEVGAKCTFFEDDRTNYRFGYYIGMDSHVLQNFKVYFTETQGATNIQVRCLVVYDEYY